MSVLVKGWSIPAKGCCGCYFRTGKYCGILSKNERVWRYAERYTRPDNCPLFDAEEEFIKYYRQGREEERVEANENADAGI